MRWPIFANGGLETFDTPPSTPVGCSKTVSHRRSMHSKSGPRNSRLAASCPPGNRYLIPIGGHSHTSEAEHDQTSRRPPPTRSVTSEM